MNPNLMPSEPSSEVKFEIGHVLFIDIVGYSKLVIHKQRALLDTLNRIVRCGAIPESGTSEPTD